MSLQFITPTWHVPPHVHACMTTRIAGVSSGAYGQVDGAHGLNLATHVGDEHAHVMANRELLCAAVHFPNEPLWLNQTHSTIVHLQTNNEYQRNAPPPEADAVVLTQGGQVGVVMTADCLPVLFASADGRVVGAAHAGWRGLVDGVLEETVRVMREQGAHQIHTWLGAAIGAAQFEVGADVLAEFLLKTPSAAGDVRMHFKPHPEHDNKYLADIYGLARDRLQASGVVAVSGGEHCTVTEANHFYSYRRDRTTGRMATLIWMDEPHCAES
ncbi:Laccase domain protein YfiH [Ephemeroptericola cinctiostellae]|uniref:Purine nucleoside phosphorylase n=1 Tax=Ephemeroptericola cinctiostellae TaxID=2268024 RepID=A0A345DDM1_9BURK|nr:peptidoglycan editing factor PgeF [Ephemeroptericola cinctiostellae]AXF86459.1 Laccase domain protein YfiH [Ephemeroptericola cinctiostellae]